MGIRDKAGRFVEGISGNPAGRRRMDGEIREALEAGAPAAARRLVELINSPDERVALLASQAVLDRLYGKPTQSVDANVKTETVAVLHLQALQEIAARREARLRSAPPTTIEI